MKFFRKSSNERRPRMARNYTNQPSGLPTNTYYRSLERTPPSSVKRGSAVDLSTQQSIKSGKLRFLRPVTIVNGALVLSLVVLLFFATTMSASVTIRSTEETLAYRPIAEYEEAASEIMNNSLINRSKILFQSAQFESTFIDKFPEIRRAEAIIPLGGRDLTLSIASAPPLAFVVNGSEKGLIDESGVLATLNTSTTEDESVVNVRFLEKQEAFSVGSRLLTTQEVALISMMKNEIANFSAGEGQTPLKIKEITLSVAKGQIQLLFENAPYYIKLSTYADAAEQVGKIKASLTQLTREGTLPSTYMDVRVDGRVFVL